MRPLRGPSVAVAVALLLASCGGDGSSFSPTVDNVSGSYSASSFTVTSSAGTLDLLDLGATADVTLAANGTTTGRLFVPGGAEGGGDLDEDLTGTWSLSGSTVTFNQTADTFIRDAPFTASQNRLTGEGTFNGQTIHIVLAKAT